MIVANPWKLTDVLNRTQKKATSTYFGVKTPVSRDNITTQIKAVAQSRMASGGPAKTEIKKESAFPQVGGRPANTAGPLGGSPTSKPQVGGRPGSGTRPFY